MCRPKDAYEIRVEAAKIALERGVEEQTPRGDDTFTLVGSYTKGLPHVQNSGRIVDRNDYDLFVRAIETGDPSDIRAVPLGPNRPPKERFISGIAQGDGENFSIADVRAWESMAAGNAFDLEGPDSQSLAMPAHPALDSIELIAEMTEIYSMALTRDVSFTSFAKHPAIQRAVDDMNATKWIAAPPQDLSVDEKGRLRGPFTTGTIFRGVFEGDDVGPYISQFLLCGNVGIGRKGVPEDGFIRYGAHRIDQRVRVVEPDRDYMTTWASWLDVQNGADMRNREIYDSEHESGYRFIATPRDLATYVHFDALYQAYLNACVILLSLGAPFDKGLPFQLDDDIDHQQAFALFGPPHILTLVTEVATRALKAVRYQKFNVHRRPRPEALAALMERHHYEPLGDLYKAGAALYNGLDSDMLERIARSNGKQNRRFSDFGHPRSEDYDPRGKSGKNFLLPMAFPEGSPMHPSYGAGHATVAGACVTILKAWFDTDFELPFAFEANTDGSSLRSCDGVKLTVGGELNKVCSNVSIGRNWAGVHYFTDYIESAKLGEAIAIGILDEQAITYHESFSMTFTKFDGSKKVISNYNRD